MHLPPLISDLALILGAAAFVTYFFRLIRQPVVLGYLMVGFLLSPHTTNLPFVSDGPNVSVLAELGIIFLMLNLGLEFSFRRLSRVGPTVALTGIFELGVMFAIGFLIAKTLGWGATDRLFLGGVVAISSTTIIVKTLDEMGLRARRFADHVLGVLIIEDVGAVLLLVLLAGVGGQGTLDFGQAARVLTQLVLVTGTWFLVGYFLIPRLVKRFGRLGSDEMIIILAVGLCLMLVRVAASFQFSAALGAFIMGSILAETTESERIAHLIKPVRDIFVAVFFVSIGLLVDASVIVSQWPLILLLTAVVVGGKILAVTIGSLMSGLSLKHSVRAGFTMAQIGEFSFIIINVGAVAGIIRPDLYPVVVAVSVLTTFTTPYLVRVSERVANRLDPEALQRLPLGRWLARSGATVVTTNEEAALPRRMITWIASGIVTTAIFETLKLLGQVLMPTDLARSPWSPGVIWFVAIVTSAPFIWAMFFAFGHWRGSRIERKILVGTSRLLTGLWIAAVTSNIVDYAPPLVLALVLAVGFYAAFHRSLGSAYQWFERQFLAPFEEKDRNEVSQSRALSHLAPWDARLVHLDVPPESRVIARTLESLRLRESFGFNIVAIRRGARNIVAPTRNEIFLPGDRLVGLGTETQVEAVREMLNEMSPGRVAPESDPDYELKRIAIAHASPLDGKTILECGIRERFEGLVVGIERAGERLMNPTSTTRILAADVLLVVGERAQLRDLQRLAQSVGMG